MSFDPPSAADERTMLHAWLVYQRESMIAKIEGLTEVQARWTPTPTANSILGLITHLAHVEMWWFHECFAGEENTFPKWGDPKDFDFDFKPDELHTIPWAVALYRQWAARGDEIAAAAESLDLVSKHPEGAKNGITLRWILVHMIEETARHAGHADITRELIDGSVGML